MTARSLLSIFVLGLASYRVTRLVVLDTLVDEPRMWALRHLAPRPARSGLGQFREGITIRGSRFRRSRIKIAEGLQCTYCVGVWITLGLCGLWHLGALYPDVGLLLRAPIIVAGICGLQALLSSWE